MVNLDAKHDYYADLDLPPTADVETIKKQFRLLAKQYHPDRNPGREIEVVPKFQAVQAAHEILCDAQLKAKYDTSRVKYLKKNEPEPGPFKRTNSSKAPPPTATFTPPPPPRNRNTSVDGSQFATGRTQPASASAEKYAAFNRAGNQQWDRAKYEDARAREEALRNFQSMRGQPSPQRPPRAPTAPKSGSTGPRAPEYARPGNLPPGFPGLSRTHSAPRRPGGFSPAPSGSDEPPAQSAYGYVHSNRDKPPPSSNPYMPPPPPPPSQPQSQAASTPPSEQRARSSGSPLRQTKSSGGFDDTQRPAWGRTPSRYAASTGERTDVNGRGIGRSASVRNSPIEKPLWGDRGPFGARAKSQTNFKPSPPRHRSASPNMRQQGGFHAEFSGTESSSEEERPPPRSNRPKAVPRRSKVTQNGRTTATNESAFEGQFPNTNYTRIVNDSQYHYPPPESRDGPPRKPFDDVTSPVNDITEGLQNATFKHSGREGPDKLQYDPHPFLNLPWIGCITQQTGRRASQTIRGIPAWALPASVYPGSQTPTTSRPVHMFHWTSGVLLETLHKTDSKDLFRNHANRSNSRSSSQLDNTNDPRPHPHHTHSTFSASDWDGKFTNNENIFRPTERDRRSPSKNSRARAPPRPRAQNADSTEDDEDSDGASPTMPGVRHVHSNDSYAKPAPFPRGNSEDWSSRMKGNQTDIPISVHETHPKKESADPRGINMPSASQDTAHPQSFAHRGIANPDAMDVDTNGVDRSGSVPTIHVEPVPSNTRRHSTAGLASRSSPESRRASVGGIDLSDLANTAPLKPSENGLDSLAADLQDSLPFKSRAADRATLTTPSGIALKDLNLPKPPKPVIPPPEKSLTQASWAEYADKIKTYMHKWKEFNTEMINHFVDRREQIDHSMYHNWVTSEGDGAHAMDVEGCEFKSPPTSAGGDGAGSSSQSRDSKPVAGYTTYMEWLELDIKCRRYWDLAVEEHRECLENLGRIRTYVKNLRDSY